MINSIMTICSTQKWLRAGYNKSDGDPIPLSNPGRMVYDSAVDFDFLSGAQDENDFEHFIRNSKTSDFSDAAIMLRPTVKELGAMGVKSEQFILRCKFNGRDCGNMDFYPMPNQKFGLYALNVAISHLTNHLYLQVRVIHLIMNKTDFALRMSVLVVSVMACT